MSRTNCEWLDTITFSQLTLETVLKGAVSKESYNSYEMRPGPFVSGILTTVPTKSSWRVRYCGSSTDYI